MKMLFVHDNKFIEYEKHFYTYGHYSYDLLWTRYLKYFDSIDVVGRVRHTDCEDDVKGFSISDGDNVRIFGLPNLMSFKGLLHYFKARKMMKERMREVDAAVIRLPSSLGNLACKVARRLKKPYAVEIVGCAWDAFRYYGNTVSKLSAVYFTLAEKHSVKNAPYAIYVSRHFLQNRYPNKHINIGCPDSNILISPQEVLDNRIKKIDSSDVNSEFRMGLVASLETAYKGHDTAIKALSVVKDKIPNVKLCFLGDGDSSKLARIAEEYGVLDKVEFCGALPGGAPVLEWLDKIDLFLMPSRQETLGRALLEAMSRACPAIGSKETAIPEQLGDDCVHPKNDYNEMARLIVYMYENPEYMKLCAYENFYRSRKYSEEFLEDRRKNFWSSFVNFAKESSNG